MRTAAELDNFLADELAWRRIELHAVLSQARSAHGPTGDALCRAGVTLLYAHWEGFAKAALTAYLRFVARRRLKMKELNPGFVALGLSAEVAKSSGLSATLQRNEMVRRLLGPGDERLHIPSREVNTQSNLNSDLCKELMDTLGLDYGPFELKSALIDYKLLKARNEIAHGRWVAVPLPEYENLHHEVVTLMATLANMILCAVDNGEYRR